MKRIYDELTLAIATMLHSFDLPTNSTFDELSEHTKPDAVIQRYRNDYQFHAKVCAILSPVLKVLDGKSQTLNYSQN